VQNLPILFSDVDVVGGGGVLDFGGGPGIYLTGFRNYAREHYGVTNSQQLKLVTMEPHPLGECLFDGLKQDTTDLLHEPLSEIPSRKYDLVMTIEVLEHIPVEFHHYVIQALTKMTKKWLVVSAAHPGQPGEGHIGPSMKTQKQWMDEILANVGDVLEYDENKTNELHRVPTWPTIKENGIVFRRKGIQ
jgi:2-polyprenyl-3-methyl-5-hydroxy-6-metoxy-1,4-benzoquinol methylase